MIIVAGWLRVPPDERGSYLAGCRATIEAARRAPGCLDFSLAADLVDDRRINVFERWESPEAVERFRGSGTSDEQRALIIDAHVEQHTVSASTPLG